VINSHYSSLTEGTNLARRIDINLQKDFFNFNAKFNKNYLTSGEFTARMRIFIDNLKIIRGNNETETGVTLEANAFADLTDQEFEKLQGFKTNLAPEGEDDGADSDLDDDEDAEDGGRRL